MIKRSVLFIIVLSQVLCLYSQDLRIRAREKRTKWGYYDLNGDKINSSEYKECYAFEEEYAMVFDEDAKKIGYINREGELVLPENKKVEFLKGGAFGMYYMQGVHSGLVPVLYKGKFGYLDDKGKMKIPAIYKKSTPFNHGYALVENKEGSFVIDSLGNKILVNIDLVDFDHYQEGLAPVRVKSGKWGFLDTKGNLVIEDKYNRVGYFVNGVAWARNKKDLIGYINTKGEWLIEPKFPRVFETDKTSGMARVEYRGYGWVDTYATSGEILRMKETKVYKKFNSGLSAGLKDGKFGFFDKTGNWVIKPTYVAVRSFSNGYAAVKENDLWGVIDTEGNWVIKPKFISIRDFN